MSSFGMCIWQRKAIRTIWDARNRVRVRVRRLASFVPKYGYEERRLLNNYEEQKLFLSVLKYMESEIKAGRGIMK